MKKRIWLASLTTASLITALVGRAVAQVGPPVSPVFRMASGPTLTGPAEHLLLCAGNLGSTTITVTLEIQQAVTGAIVAGPENITLRPLTGPSVGLPSDPCLEFPGSVTTAAVAATPAATAVRPLYIGRVSVNPQPLPPSTACFNGKHFIGDLVASLQVFTPLTPAVSAGTTIPTMIRYIPVVPADPCLPIGPIFAAGT
jgi:hypothetical protein